jgi:WD40 repeat protein
LKTWKGVPVASTTHVLNILPVKPRPKVEPVSPNLIASLVHPDRLAGLWGLEFSPDGAKLFTSGYTSGIVQFWDLASKKEIRRINTPPGYRSFSNYALLTPDWKTLYVPVEKRTVKRFERDGKRGNRFEYAGKIRVWDVASGKEKDPLWSSVDNAPGYAVLAPDGRYLTSLVQPSRDSSDTKSKAVTVVWDLIAGKKWKLHEGNAEPSFSPDGKTIALGLNEYAPKSSAIMLFDLGTGKQLANAVCPEKERVFSIGSYSSNGKFLAVNLGGKKGNPLEVWFLDGKTLEVRGKLMGKGGPNDYWGGFGLFTPDGKRYVALDRAGNVLLWDAEELKPQRAFAIGIQTSARLAISPDGKTLAVGWMPEFKQDRTEELEPADMPQPRVTLVDLAGASPPRVLVAPHGYNAKLAFSPDGKTLAFGGAGAVHLFDLTK